MGPRRLHTLSVTWATGHEQHTADVGRRDAGGRRHRNALAELAAVPLPQRVDDAVQQERLACADMRRALGWRSL